MTRSRTCLLPLALLTALLALALVGGQPGVRAAPLAQLTALPLVPLQEISGTLNADMPEAAYTFALGEGAIFSIVARPTSGNLAIDLAVTDAAGEKVAEGARLDAGGTVRFGIEAATAPTKGVYTLVLRRVGDTAGEYVVALLPGYSVLAHHDRFEQDSSPLALTWDTDIAAGSAMEVLDGGLSFQIMSAALFNYIVPEAPPDAAEDELRWADLYIEADVVIEDRPSYFEYGFVVRLSPDEGEFYAVEFSSDGDWAVHYYDGDWLPIQDWTVSPLVDPGDREPRIGLFVQGHKFKVFFNGSLVGTVDDVDQLLDEGGIGLSAATGIGQPDALTLHFDNLVITCPAAQE